VTSTGRAADLHIRLLTRKFGLSIDNLAGAEVVTADGRVLHASAAENPDLF
jgi:FAD/FMN-containing dehydrogenase